MIDSDTWGLIYGLVAAIATAVAAYLQAKNTQAGQQGDVLAATAQHVLDMASALVPFIPELKDPVAKLTDLIAQLKAGWDDKAVTTTQLLAIKSDISAVVSDITNLVKAKGVKV
jgi:hypothetical protein